MSSQAESKTAQISKVVADPTDPTDLSIPAPGAETMGFAVEQSFLSRAQEELSARDLNRYNVDLAAQQLQDMDADILPSAAPIGPGGVDSFGLLRPDDKTAIKESEAPLITLWGLSRLRSGESQKAYNVGQERDRLSVLHEENEMGLLSAMGMVHGTSYGSLLGAVEQGSFLPNRGISDSQSGNTTFIDRDLGLDDFVFADFGRPNALRRHTPPDVEVVFDLKAFMEPGSFATEKDIADCPGGVEEYMRGVVEPGYFLEAALLKLDTTVAATPGNDITFGRKLTAKMFADGVDGDPTTAGKPLFSTWEMKMPRVDAGHMKKIIFRNPEQLEAFRARFGEGFNLELVKPGEKPKYYDESEAENNREKLAAVNAEAYHDEMTARLAALPDDEKETVVVALQPAANKARQLHMEREFVTGDRGSQIAVSDEELSVSMQWNPVGSIEGMDGVPYLLTDKNGEYVRVVVERSKQPYGPARFIQQPELVQV